MTPEQKGFGWLRRFVDGDAEGIDFGSLDRAWTALLERSGVSDAELTQTVADAYAQAPFLRQEVTVDPAATRLLDRTTVERLWAIPVAASAGSVSVATPNVGDPDLTAELRFMLARDIRLLVTSPSVFQELIRTAVSEGIEEVAASWSSPDREDPAAGSAHVLTAGDARVGGRILDRLVSEGTRLGASDVHVQASGNRGLVRFRVDGVLRLGPELSMDELRSVVARAKAVGGMDPSIRLKPQDGRARIVLQNEAYDLRISTLPASQSESLVVRILAQVPDLKIETSGFDDFTVGRLRAGFLDQSAGIFTVTGPTGSGKTTLLYTLLSEINLPERDIHTVEDPIELHSPGLIQVQVNPRAGMTFASALRSILRQDPEVILVGETRDEETAQMVMQAALTGHLVATTLHTIDAPTAILRYRDLGVDPGELAEALRGASAQRLVRTLCPHCREEVRSAASDGERWFEEITGGLPAFRTTGCDRCDFSGYRGRMAIGEVLLVDPDMRHAIHAGAPLVEIRERATAGGMRSMGELGLDRVREGVTDVAELRRVLGMDLLPTRRASPPSAPGPGAAVSAGGAEIPESVGKPADVIDQAVRVSEVSEGALSVVALFIDLAPNTGPPQEALAAAGLLAYRCEDIPHGAVWAEIHRPEVIVLDVSEDVDTAMQSVARARDALLHLDFAPIVIVPESAPDVERVMLEHGFEDFLAAPVGVDELSFLVRRVLRRRQLLEGGTASQTS
jgi:type II secretory ATPase GspE/PulE/Tfp pilus assembly ATPase PilB-like protein